MLMPNDLYPSRQGRAEAIGERQDPVVFGNASARSEYSLSEDQVRSYEQNGFIALPGLMKDVVEPMLEEVRRLGREMGHRKEVVTEPDSDEVRSIFAAQNFSPMVDRISRDRRLLDVARQLLDSEVYVHQSRVNVKPPIKGKSFQWHSDFETWHVEDGMPRCRVLTGWVMLTDNTPYNGPLFVIPGSHRWYVAVAGETPENNYEQSLKKQVAGVPSLESIEWLTKRCGEIQGVYGEPGTVVFHEGNIMHASPDNISPNPRTNLMFVYNSVENTPHRPFSGQEPRPAHLANRDFTPLAPVDPPR
ncbi:phytanoyl-CoA dioxygenase family protein [Alkalilimnicola ehrlichii MLHE-1]|uniref:Phytanoyl-CoA dioxygenase n=1 Tax=Alkalilimnicola ehrlichii (strain ATCC BAA-1101 / DSM 17681 / MLHE-1) TaxID=187272 RepID=Q0ABP1_ALKEH|nr:phytanoyl-CoA dioxygenase family protein [Alkalilimnicola ehrlichii]ABI55746.1 Phytanoyl-CoA dioxygenase [Alkalilimnicola ehrlichii MLHE-1]AER00257.1 ectoine hydroxylase [synthetic construct]